MRNVTLPQEAALPISDTYPFPHVLYLTGFIIPLVFAGPQLVIGTLVNTLLFLSAHHLPEKHLLPLAVVPGVGAALHGTLFGPQTVVLWHILPVIWVGNVLLMKSSLALRAKHPALRIAVSAGVKYLWLTTLASGLVTWHMIPPAFLSAMGIMQVITALSGGKLAYGITRIITVR